MDPFPKIHIDISYDEIFDKAKRFVRKHPTLTACFITAMAASKITYTVTADIYRARNRFPL